MYNFVYGNSVKKDLNFQFIMHERFDDGKKLGELIDLVMEGKLTVLNGKEVLYAIVDGEQKTAEELARIRGLLGAKDVDVKEVVRKVMEKEFVTVNKIKQTKAKGPIMFLVG